METSLLGMFIISLMLPSLEAQTGVVGKIMWLICLGYFIVELFIKPTNIIK